MPEFLNKKISCEPLVQICRSNVSLLKLMTSVAS